MDKDMNYKKYGISMDKFDAPLSSLIKSNWARQKKNRGYDFSDLTYYLFDNLYRSIKDSPEKMEVAYDTLIKLNEEVENEEMVRHLQMKKKEYFKDSVVITQNMD